jgi:formate dehydrogenase subunit gamma
MTRNRIGKVLGALGFAAALAYATAAGLTGSPTLGNQAFAQAGGEIPSGGVRGVEGSSETWRAVRKGVEGYVSIPDKKAGVLVQSEGDNLRAFRNGPMSVWGGWGMLAMLVLVALYYLLHGPIKVTSGASGRTIERFTALDRIAHWLTATSFVILALTGLNVLYGRYVLMPIIGQGAFAQITYWGKLSHNYIAFAFMVGVVMIFVLWIKHNLPTMADLKWLAVGGGMFGKGAHPPAYKFNAGQKIVFWATVIGGGLLAVSGICLLFPFEFAPWAPTFKVLNMFGLGLPTQLTALQETQLSLLWHGVVALIMIALILGHIYLGTIGMEGALDAVTTGYVDENWAREHHPLWVAELKGGGH